MKCAQLTSVDIDIIRSKYVGSSVVLVDSLDGVTAVIGEDSESVSSVIGERGDSFPMAAGNMSVAALVSPEKHVHP